MRVKISYSIDINEVVEETAELFGYVSDKVTKIQAQTDTVRDLLFEEDVESSYQLMQKLRATLSAADARIADLSLILEGYSNYKRGLEVNNETSSGRPAVDTTSDNALQGTEQPDGGEVQR